MKDKFISKRFWKSETTPMGEVDELAKQFADVINLSIGDPDLATDWRITEPAFEDAKAGHTKYTDFRGDPELRKEIRNCYREDFHLDIRDEEIFVAAGGCLAMYLVLEAILDEKDEVIIQAPYFTPYKQQVELAGGIPVALDTAMEEQFQIHAEQLEGLVTVRTKAIIINTPNNPTGTCLTGKSLETVAAFAKKYDLLVIADDIYGAFSYEAPFIPMLSMEGMKKRTITINSFSKNYIMTGWRVGNIIAPANIIKTIQHINENVMFTAPSVSQRAAIYALRQRKELQPPVVEAYRKRVCYAAERANRIPGMSVLAPKATFYLFVNIEQTGLSSRQVSDVILEEAHVVTIPGIAFGDCGEGFIRIACTVNLDLLQEAFDRIEQVFIFQPYRSSTLLR